MEKLKAGSYIMGNQNKDIYHVKWKSPRFWDTLQVIATARVQRTLHHYPALTLTFTGVCYIFWACANPFYQDCCVPHLSRSHPGSGGLGLQHSVSDSRAQALIHLTGALHPPLGAPFPQAQFADAHLSHGTNCASRAGTVLSATSVSLLMRNIQEVLSKHANITQQKGRIRIWETIRTRHGDGQRGKYRLPKRKARLVHA